jgi:hypothetical protein
MAKQTAVIIERQFVDDDGKVVVFRHPQWKVACWDAIEALPDDDARWWALEKLLWGSGSGTCPSIGSWRSPGSATGSAMRSPSPNGRRHPIPPDGPTGRGWHPRGGPPALPPGSFRCQRTGLRA